MSLSGYPKEAALKDGREVIIRPLSNGDFDMLTAFFSALPAEDRMFLRHDVTDPEVVGRWIEHLDYSRVIPLVAEDRDDWRSAWPSELVQPTVSPLPPEEFSPTTGERRMLARADGVIEEASRCRRLAPEARGRSSSVGVRIGTGHPAGRRSRRPRPRPGRPAASGRRSRARYRCRW